MVSISDIFLIPNTEAGSTTVTALASESSTITEEYDSGIVMVNVQVNGAATVDIKRSHLANSNWQVYYTDNIDNTEWFRYYIDVRDERYQLVITSREAVDDIEVKGYITAYDGLSYVTLYLFRDITGIATATVSDSYVCRSILDTYDKVNQHTGKSRTTPWASTDVMYLKVQKAHAMLAAHDATIRGWDSVPINNKKVADVSTPWLYQYCLEIFDITGEYPYQLPGLPEVKQKNAMPFEASVSLVQVQDTDGDSYTVTSTR